MILVRGILACVAFQVCRRVRLADRDQLWTYLALLTKYFGLFVKVMSAIWSW